MNSDPRRDRQIREALVEARLDGLICRLPENLVCLTGYYPHVGLSFVVYPAGDERGVVRLEGRWAGEEIGAQAERVTTT